nr:hypothetical protein CFP56_22550 [Quercus suber]
MAGEVQNSGFSACRMALNNWVIFSRIFAWMSDFNTHYDCCEHYLETYTKREPRCQVQEMLRRCCLVSRSWFYQAAPCLWRDLDCADVAHMTMVTNILSAIPDSRRRQYYASLIHSCTDYTRDRIMTSELDDIKFPNLKALTLNLGGGHVPNLHVPSLRSLVIDPQSKHCSPCEYDIAQEEMKTIFQALPILFPNLESVIFEDRVRVYHGALENLATQLPHLKHFNHKHNWPSDSEKAENSVSSLEDDDSEPYDGGFETGDDDDESLGDEHTDASDGNANAVNRDVNVNPSVE